MGSQLEFVEGRTALSPGLDRREYIGKGAYSWENWEELLRHSGRGEEEGWSVGQEGLGWAGLGEAGRGGGHLQPPSPSVPIAVSLEGVPKRQTRPRILEHEVRKQGQRAECRESREAPRKPWSGRC